MEGGRRKRCVESGEGCVEGEGAVFLEEGGRGVCRREERCVWRKVGEGCAKEEGEADCEACGVDKWKRVEWEGSESEQG